MKLIFASHNRNKADEIRAMLPSGYTLETLDEIGCHEEIPETADTLEGNAALKADFVSKNYRLDCFADDTGLEVVVLNGAPGVYSARYAGASKSSEANMDKLLTELTGASDRSAQFRTVIALNLNGKQHFFTGAVTGRIIEEKRGKKGFGYDPVFVPDGYDRTFAEMDMQEKAALSHRGRALQKLMEFLETMKD